jgi:predicted dehydrogenase
MKQVNVGIVGCGEFAELQHFPNCIANSKVKVKAICDIVPQRMDYICKNFALEDIFKTTDYNKLFAMPDLDLIILATDHGVHLELIEKAAMAGKHILVEKPMVMTHQESQKVIRFVKESGIKLCVDYNRPYSPSMLELKKQLELQRKNPMISPWRSVRSEQFPTLYEEQGTNLVITINDEIDSYRTVHLDPEKGGGVIIGESCHFLDLACWLIDRRPVRIYASGSSRLSHSIILNFEDGSLVNIFFSACGTFDYPKERYELTAKGNLLLNEFFVETAVYGRGEVVRSTYPMQYDEFDQQVTEVGLAGYLAKRAIGQKQVSRGSSWPILMPDKGHRNLLNAFVEAIIEDKPSPVDEYRGARATYLSSLAIESIRTGLPLPVQQEELELFID